MNPIFKNRGDAFQATLTEKNGDVPAVVLSGHWSSSDESIATVDPDTGAGTVSANVSQLGVSVEIIYDGFEKGNNGQSVAFQRRGAINVSPLPDDFHGVVDFA